MYFIVVYFSFIRIYFLKYTSPLLGYIFPLLKYTSPLLGYIFPLSKYTSPLLGYIFPLSKYTSLAITFSKTIVF